VEASRIVLRRDPSPVVVDPEAAAEPPPPAAGSRGIILYSGNWGVAHDHETFVEGYRRFCSRHPDKAWLWLNATGNRVEMVSEALGSFGLPFSRTAPVPLERLAGVLLAADVHIITLEDAFVGYVMPSKVYACIASGRPILFIGSADSDVHALCERHLPSTHYARVDVGNADGFCSALGYLLDIGMRSRKRQPGDSRTGNS
jgi:hypothetical protein